MTEFGNISDVNPVFTHSQFYKGVIYHVLFFFVLGPMIIPFMLCFETTHFMRNTAFLPAKASMMFFVIQIMTWMMYMMGLMWYIMDIRGMNDSMKTMDITGISEDMCEEKIAEMFPKFDFEDVEASRKDWTCEEHLQAEVIASKYLSIIPIMMMTINLLLRLGVISTRHGTTPPPFYEQMSLRTFEAKDFRESLIQFAWV
jgi:hypothetical protein